MSNGSTPSLKSSDFTTWAESTDAEQQTVQVAVDHKAATRQAIIIELLRKGFAFKMRHDWKAKPSTSSDGPDWYYTRIALHHAGNSFSCEADGVEQLRKAEETDMDKFGHISYHYAISCDGTIYEALDIREKGAHISRGNTGVIGIVMLADFSIRGEAYKAEYEEKSLFGRIKGALDWGSDKLDVTTDEPTGPQIDSLFALVKELLDFFPVTMLGGHREFQRIATGEGRACPGIYGMILVDKLRRDLGLMVPEPAK